MCVTVTLKQPNLRLCSAFVLAGQRRPFDISRYAQRYVALEVMYLGWRYNGFAYQQEDRCEGTSVKTVEVRMGCCEAACIHVAHKHG